MADKITNDITLLFKTKLDEKSKQEVGKNLRSLLENAAIGFDEAETKRNLEPIVRMMQKLFDKAEIAFDADKLLSMPSRQALQEMAKMEVDQLQMAFDKALAKSGGVKIDFGDIGLSELAAPLKQIENELSDVSRKIADTTKKSVYEIEQSLKSISKNKSFKKIVSPESIENALVESSNDKKIHPSRAIDQLEKARALYDQSVKDDNPWVVQYKYLLDFVSKYEKLTHQAKQKIESERPEFTQLYDMLSPKAGAVKVSLEHYVDVARGNELSEYKNQPWGRETTLKQIRDSLKNGITVKDGGDDNNDPPKESSKATPTHTLESNGEDANKGKKLNTKLPSNDIGESDAERTTRLARERTEDTTKQVAEAEKALAEARHISAKKIYRTVYSPIDEEDLSREERKAQYGGAEIWTSSSEVANTYADGEEDPVMLKGSLSAKNAYIIDANGATWKDFGKMQVLTPDSVDENGKVKFSKTMLRDEFPDLFKRIDNKEFDYEEDIQAELYKAIKSLGYDSLATKNVIDAKDVERYKEPSTIYAVFDDNALDVLGAYAVEEQDEYGIVSFEDKAHRENIPEYYKMPEHIQAETAAHQENTAAIIEETKAQEKLNEVKTQNVDVDDSSKELKQSQKIISVQKQWLEYLDGALNDDNFKTDGKRAATERLSTITKNLVDYRRHPEEYAGEEMRGEKLVVMWNKAYEEAKRQGVAQSTLTRNYTDAIDEYDRALEKLQKQQNYSLQTIAREEAKINALQQPAQDDSVIHQENTESIIAETQAQEKLNQAKLEEQPIDIRDDVAATAEQPVVAVQPADVAESKSSIQTEDLRSLLSAITYNVKVVQDAEPEENNKVSIDATELKNVLDGIIYNVKLAHDDVDKESNKISIDESTLESVLKKVVYNVKLSHDDNDKESNKIAIDEKILESTLNRVFANVLNPEIDPTEAEPKNEPWALEKTLLSVKEVLDVIKTNTAKPESLEVAPAKTDVGNVLATENTLSAIKTAVESINSKVVKGTKAKASESGGKKTGVGKKNAESYAGSQYFPEKLKTQTMQLAKFRAQLMTTGKLTDDVDAQIYELLNGLKQVQNGPDFSKWSQKFQQLKTSVGITDIFDKADGKDAAASYQQLIEFQKIRNKLELQYEKAQDGSALKQFYAEQLAQMDSVIAKQEEMLENEEYEAKLAKMREEQARKLGEAEAKANDKDAKKQATAAKKLAQREAMLGKAGSAVGRAESTWMSAVDIEDELPADFVAEIDEYYQKLDALRKKHQELKNSDMISEEQKKDLIAQTMSVNKMTEEIGGLVSEYQRLSGDNTTVIGQNTLDSEAGLGAYEQQLKQAVITATNGKAQIKNFDAATKTLTYTVKTGKNEFTEYTALVRRLGGQLVSVQGTTKRTETFFEATARKMKELTSYFSGMAIFNRVGQELRRGIQYVREIDDALVELRKVTDETADTYDKFLQTAAKTGAKLGATIAEVTEATSTFAKLGYTIEQSTEMAEAALVYKNVGDNIASTEDAADSIISTLKGFGLESSETMRIVDRFNEVGNRFAITSQGIGEALRLSASALNEGGNTLDESIGLITAANEVVNDPSSVGTALKTLTLRLRGSKTELEEMGEDVSDMATTTSQLQAKLLALTGGQVDIMLDENTFKSSTQILREMSDAWEDMTDIQRASALELMGGKRQANVLSALISNFDTAEDAIEASANSAGSAMKENEVWLDSISGKVSQFNNATQSMWSNLLDSDVVKGFVEWGTKIIKSLDTVQGKFLALVKVLAIFMAYKKINPLDWITKLGDISNVIKTDGLKNYIMSLFQVSAAQKTVTADTLVSTIAQQQNDVATQQQIISRLGLTNVTGALTAAQKIQAAQELVTLFNGGMISKDLATRMAAMLGYKFSVDATNGATVTLDTTTKSFMASNPVGWILLIVSAIMALVMWLANTESRVEKLRNKLSDLQSELSDIKSEIDSVNSELETTQDRMAELLAMDTLSFTEQEELDRLEKENEELQRKLDLLELQNKQKSKEAAKTFVETMQKDEKVGDDKHYSDGSKATFWSEIGWNTAAGEGGEHPGYLSESGTIDLKIQEYKDYEEELADIERQIIAAGGEETDTGKLLKKDKDKIETEMSAIETYVTGKTDQWIKDSEGVEYFTGDNLEDWQIESNKWLDMINDTQDKWAIASGGNNAMSNAIKNVLGREEFSDESDQINKYVEDLKSGDTSAKASIEGIINSNTDLKNALTAKGIDHEDAISYFTDLSSTSAFDTIEGKIAEVSQAATNFEKLLNGESFQVDGVDTGLADLFNEEGKIIQTKLSQVFQDTSDQTRAEITKLLEGSYDMIADGLDDAEINYLMNRMGLSFSRAILEIEETNLAAKNLELFPGLEDEISGIIDTFSELTSAVGSVVDALDTLDQARAEEAYSGSMSLETLEALMQSTDNYADLIEVDETGAIHLATNAQEVLVAQKLEAIKQNAELALKEAELAYQEALHTEQTYSQTGPAQEFMRGLWNEVGGAMAFVSSLWGDLTSGNWDGAWKRAKAAQEASITTKETEYANQAADASAAVADAAKKVENAEKMNKIAQGLTPENVKARYSADEASGGADDPEEVAENAFKAAMDYWENRISANQARYEQLQNEIDLLEAKGQKADASYYEEQIELENERLSLLEQQKAEAQSFLGTFAEGSDEWFRKKPA